MPDIEKAIGDFFAIEGDTYVNGNSVEIALLKGSICVTAHWPEEQLDKNVSLVIMKVNENFVEFALDFGIEDDVREAIESINIHTLMSLYLAGTGKICCSIEGRHAALALEFFKQGDRIVAKDDSGAEHDVKESLKTPQAFIEYARKYFELNQHLDGFAKYKPSVWKLGLALN